MQDLIEIWLAIARHNPPAADRVLEAIEERWKTLSRFPSSGMERNAIAPGIWHLGEGHYLTLYRVIEHSVEIVRVLYGRRKIDRKIVS